MPNSLTEREVARTSTPWAPGQPRRPRGPLMDERPVLRARDCKPRKPGRSIVCTPQTLPPTRSVGYSRPAHHSRASFCASSIWAEACGVPGHGGTKPPLCSPAPSPIPTTFRPTPSPKGAQTLRRGAASGRRRLGSGWMRRRASHQGVGTLCLGPPRARWRDDLRKGHRRAVICT